MGLWVNATIALLAVPTLARLRRRKQSNEIEGAVPALEVGDLS
jgi:hypothetical protein